MPAKIKPSTKEYIKDKNGKQTNNWVWRHYTICSTSTGELEKLYKSPSYKRKKEMIKRELQKRGIKI